jgi:hypothetical protein
MALATLTDLPHATKALVTLTDLPHATKALVTLTDLPHATKALVTLTDHHSIIEVCVHTWTDQEVVARYCPPLNG